MLEQVKNAYHQTLNRNSMIKTVALVAGAVVLAPAVASILKPVAKASIKTGVILYQKTKGAIAEAGEQVGDLVAEAKAEVLAEQAAKQELPAIEAVQDHNA